MLYNTIIFKEYNNFLYSLINGNAILENYQVIYMIILALWLYTLCVIITLPLPFIRDAEKQLDKNKSKSNWRARICSIDTFRNDRAKFYT